MTRTIKVVMTNEFEVEITPNTDLSSHWVTAHLLELAKKAFMNEPHSTFINQAKYEITEETPNV
jgi:hypothetical protein